MRRPAYAPGTTPAPPPPHPEKSMACLGGWGGGGEGGGGGGKPSDVAALTAVGGVNQPLATREGPPKPLCWSVISVSPSEAGRGTSTLRIHTATMFSAECKHSAVAAGPTSLQECKQWGGPDLTSVAGGGGGGGGGCCTKARRIPRTATGVQCRFYDLLPLMGCRHALDSRRACSPRPELPAAPMRRLLGPCNVLPADVRPCP